MHIPDDGSGLETKGSVTIQLFNGLDILQDGRPLGGLSSEKGRAILAYLATESEKAHSRQCIAALFWPDLPPDAARANLRQVLLNLRRVLGKVADTCLLTATHSVRFNPGCIDWLDITGFTTAYSCKAPPPSKHCTSCLVQMERGAEIYRGAFLDGLQLDNAPDFEEWLCIKRENYHRQALGLLERLSDCHEKNGNVAQALHFARRYLELEPWDEHGHCRVMRLLARGGQTGAAVLQFESCREVLRRELGIEPGSGTLELLQQIRAGQFTNASAEMPPAAATAERRQATALYCTLATRGTDPEEIAERMAAVRQECADTIRRAGGYVAQIHGSAILGYFGYPAAFEDAARKAVQTALDLHQLGDTSIEVRTVLHTGLVVSNAELPDSLGTTSKLAIHLHHCANEAVVVSEATRQLVSGYFHMQPLGLYRAEDTAAPLQIFKVSGEIGASHRFEASLLRGDRLSPLVGRADELDTLLTRWHAAGKGQRSVVFIHGEAGIGKSRLVHVLQERLAGDSCTMRELRCFSESSQSPFYPLISLFTSLCHFSPDDTDETKKEKLRRFLLANYPQADGEAFMLLAEMMSLPADIPATLSPDAQKKKLVETLIGLLALLAAKEPVLYVIEDLHWIDPSTMELISRFIDGDDKGAILMLLTARPAFVPPWHEERVETIELRALTDKEMAKVIDFWGEDIPPEETHRIVTRADGIPLFAEEMAKMAQSGMREIPATLHDLLTARLDATGEAKRTAQLAATIGREFDQELLSRIVPQTDNLKTDLQVLLDAGLILQSHPCQFKHALIADAAYHSQTRADRQAAHRKIAEVLQNTNVAKTQPEILARHLAAGGETVSSIECWIQAGKRAAMYSANVEAEAHFRAGLELVALLPAGDKQKTRLEFTLQTALGVALQATQGYGSIEATSANARASALSGQIEHGPELFLAQWTHVMNTIASSSSREALGPARRLLEAVHNDPIRMQAAHYAVADAAFWSGDFRTARTHTEMAIALYQPNHHSIQVEQFNEDLSVSCAAYLAWSSHFLGEPNEALQICNRMLEKAREFAHPHTLALALCFASVLHRWQDLPTEALKLSSETTAISRQHDFPVWLAAGEMVHGWAKVRLEKNESGISELKSSIAGMKKAIGGISVVFLSALVEAYVYLGMNDSALDLITETLEDAERTGDGHYTAELYRLEGECLLCISNANRGRAEVCFIRALETSRKQSAKTLELRAAMSLARHFGDKEALFDVYA